MLEIKAASINYPDLLIINNHYQIKPHPPFVPGYEYSGVVLEVGSDVKTLSPGDRVASISTIGGFATHSIVDENKCYRVPDSMEYPDAAAITLTYATAYHALTDRAAINSADTVLVLGSSGGVGSAAIQLANLEGARVIAVASTDEKCEFARSIGATEAINYNSGDLRTAIAKMTESRGPSIIVDPVGGPLADIAIRSLAWAGRYLIIGFSAGNIPTLKFNLPLLKGANIYGVYWGEFSTRHPELDRKNIQKLYEHYRKKLIKPTIGANYRMSDLPAALRRMEDRAFVGKIVLIND